MTPTQPLATPAAQQIIQGHASDAFQAWLSQAKGAIAFTTYQANKLILAGWNDSQQQMTLVMRHFLKPMGLAASQDGLALATQDAVWFFANAPQLAPTYLENQPGVFDALYLPRAVYLTGDLNTHDLAFAQGELWLTNTRFSCLSTLSHSFNFIPRWQPPFISQLAPEDRCHLNGVAIADRMPKFVTALGETDDVGGWRANKASGGIVIDVEHNEIVLRGLSMPHSPVWHQGYLWVLNSGTGELWRINPATFDYDVVCSLPGFLRGLTLVGNHALIGLCQIRERHIFGNLPVQQRFETLKCGVAIADIQTGEMIGLLEFTAGCRELFAIQFLSHTVCPNLLNPEQPAVQQAFSAPDLNYWLRPSAEIQGSA